MLIPTMWPNGFLNSRRNASTECETSRFDKVWQKVENTGSREESIMPRNVKPKGEDRDEAKYQAYRQYWGQLPKHMATGAYVQVIAMVEHIIMDRLWSYMVNVRSLNGEEVSKLDFGKLIKNGKS